MSVLPGDENPLNVTQPAQPPPPAEQAEQLRLNIERSEAWMGPLPPPEAFAAYEQVLPGATDRIMKMAESDLQSRNAREDRATDAVIERSKTGQSTATFLTVVSLLASIGFFAVGNNIAGPVLLGMPLVLIVRAFLSRDG